LNSKPLTRPVGNYPSRYSNRDTPRGNIRELGQHGTSANNGVVSDIATHQDNGPRANVNVVSDCYARSRDRGMALADNPSNGRVGVDLSACGHIATFTDRKTSTAVYDRERADPTFGSDFRLTQDPRVGVIRIGRNVVPLRTLVSQRYFPIA
jgi:hypothetical protein